jgi:hypothetical protein
MEVGMSDKVFAEGVSMGVAGIDFCRFLAKAGHIVSLPVAGDHQTGGSLWTPVVEAASIKKPVKAIGTIGREIISNRAVEAVSRILFLKRTVLLSAAMVLFGTSYAQAPLLKKQQAPQQPQTPVTVESEIDREIRLVMEKGINLELRRKQVAAIAVAFARRTDDQRARWLAALCYLKTLGTPFMPIDIAQLALAETGGFGLSGEAVSPKGAVGVWQLMPKRAESHGYSVQDMRNDEKCADAAVRELTHKLAMAKGNIAKAKRLYCGAGPQADAYEIKIKKIRNEILRDLDKVSSRQVKYRHASGSRPS